MFVVLGATTALLLMFAVLSTPALAANLVGNPVGADCTAASRGTLPFSCDGTPTGYVLGVSPNYTCPSYASAPTCSAPTGSFYNCDASSEATAVCSCGVIDGVQQISCSGACQDPVANPGTCSPGQTWNSCGFCSGVATVILDPPSAQTGNVEIGGGISATGDVTGGQFCIGAGNCVASWTDSGPWQPATGGINYADGNVGIGTTAPSQPLEAFFSGDKGILIKSSDSHASLYIDSAGTGGQYIRFTQGGTNQYWINGVNGGHLDFRPGAGAAAVRFTSSGNVGIGTTAPNNLLHVAGLVDFNNAISGTFLGYQAGLSTTGTLNTAVGYQALTTNATGSRNTAFGYQALTANTGSQNTAIGSEVLKSNSSGNYNSGMGRGALYNNTTGSNNTAVGYQSLLVNTTGGYNIALGADALHYNDSGSANVAAGWYALYKNTTGSYNVAVGRTSFYNNETGLHNTGVGSQSGYYQTGSYNTAVGYASLYGSSAGTGGQYNTAMGRYALFGVTTGNGNTAVGYYAGYDSGYDANTGSYNTFIGYGTGFNDTTSQYDRATAIGYNASVGCSDCISLGNGAMVGVGTSTPTETLDVNGYIALQGKQAFRGNDTWLRLNQSGAFTSGTHTPGNFAPGALNVGGASSWGDPGGGNAWFTGSIGIGTTALDNKINVADGDVSVTGGRYRRLKIESDDYWAGIEIAAKSTTEAGHPHIDFTKGSLDTPNYSTRLVASAEDTFQIQGTNVLIPDGTLDIGNALQIDGNTVIDDGAGWHRSYGNTGWFNGTHGGGWYMSDSTWIRSYGSKSVYVNTDIAAGDAVIAGGSSQVNSNAKLVVNGIAVFDGGSSNCGTCGNSTLDSFTEGMSIAWNESGGRGETNLYTRRGGGWEGGFWFHAASLNTTIFWIKDNGSYGYTGKPFAMSDIRLKKDIETLDSSLENILQLRGVQFRWKDPTKSPRPQFGLIAQEVEGVFPELVEEAGTDDGMLSVTYEGLIPVLIEATKEQQALIDAIASFDEEGKAVLAGDVHAPGNAWGEGSGWIMCEDGAECACPDGKFVTKVRLDEGKIFCSGL